MREITRVQQGFFPTQTRIVRTVGICSSCRPPDGFLRRGSTPVAMEVHNSTTIREIARRVQLRPGGPSSTEMAAPAVLAYGYASEDIDPSAAVMSRRGPKPKKRVVINEAEARGGGRSSRGSMKAAR